MDDQRAKAAATFGADFMREARTTPVLPSNSMVASQANANSRPVPTFAKGGSVVVKKASGGGILGTKASPVSAVKVKPGATVAARPAAAARKEAIISRRKDGGAMKKKAEPDKASKPGKLPLKDDWGDTIANGKLKRAGPKEWTEDGTPAKMAAGGVGKVRKGQAREPGRGPKLDNAF